MQGFFVNLPLSWVVRDPRWLDRFIAEGIEPEFGMDTVAVQELDAAWHKATAARLRKAGLRCGVHLPFFDLHPGSFNDGVLAATRETLARGAGYAALYSPEHMVGHMVWDGGQHGQAPEKWRERAVGTWQMVLGVCDAPLRLENVWETRPEPLAALMEVLPRERVGFCFDVGHWHCFSGGVRDGKAGLVRWLAALGDRIGHLHLHDNDGTGDQHLGMGAGEIPLVRLFEELAQRGVRASMTLEAHDEEGLMQSRLWMRNNGGLLRQVWG